MGKKQKFLLLGIYNFSAVACYVAHRDIFRAFKQVVVAFPRITFSEFTIVFLNFKKLNSQSSTCIDRSF